MSKNHQSNSQLFILRIHDGAHYVLQFEERYRRTIYELKHLFDKFPSQDPFETKNMESTLTAQEKSFLHDTLEHMKGCKGKQCILPRKNHLQIGQDSEDTPNNINAIPYRPPKRRHGKF